MSKFTSERIRNIVLVGHGAVGKTTLADQMLFKAGVGSRAGSVDDGTSQLDTDDEARLHHFSISSAMVHFEHHGMRVNVIDTPGYPDFVGQVISAICAAETALITINASAGIEANTRRTFELAGKAHLARIIVINKLDQDNVDFAALIEINSRIVWQELCSDECALRRGSQILRRQKHIDIARGKNGSVVDPGRRMVRPSWTSSPRPTMN